MTRSSEHDQAAEPVASPDALIVVGGSAGSFAPLRELVAGLPADLPAAVLVVVHRSERTPSRLAEILSRAGPLPVSAAQDGELILPGHIYVAPPRRHLLTGYGWIRLHSGPRVNRHRPAIDLLFASTVRWTGGRTVAVVLSGVLDDGAVGAALVAQGGGRVLVQDPAEAAFADMPAAALAAAPGAHTAPDNQLARGVLDHLAEIGKAAELPAVHVHGREVEMEMSESSDPGFLADGESKLTRMVCPECGGSLAQLELPQITYFRCHTGHQYAPQTLAASQAEVSESKLWAAVAALEEQAVLLHFLDGAATGGANGAIADAAGADRFAEQTARRAAILREQARKWTMPVAGQPEETAD